MSHHHNHINNYNRAFAIGITLNIAFVIIEVIYGVIADSLALIADAGHNLSDVATLLLAWGANYLATKQSTKNRTYGFRRVTILTSLISSIILLVALGGIAWEALHRFSSPQPVDTTIVMVVAAIGVIINAATALLFVSGQKHDLNIRAAYLHMAADAGISFGVVVAGIIMMLTGWLWIDAVLSLVIVVVILIGTWSLFKESFNLSIDAVPEGINTAAIHDYLINLENVSEVHDLHIWALSTTETALTAHLIVTDLTIDNIFLQRIQQHLHNHFGIEHITIQVEHDSDLNLCILNRPECI